MSSEEISKQVTDVAAASITVSAFIDMLPAWAAGFTLIWTVLRIYDWIEGRVKRKKHGMEIRQDEPE